MARPSEIVLEAARAYAFRLERGLSPTEARSYLEERFGLDPATVREAVAQAQRGIRIGEKLAFLPQKSPLKEALVGQKQPEESVAVRVRVEIQHGGQSSTWATVYVDATWDWTVQQVEEEARQLALAADKDYGPISRISTEFVGPTLWGKGP